MTESFEQFLVRREAASNDYVRGDATALAALLTPHDPATFLPPSGAVVTGADTVRDAQVSGAAAFSPDGTGRFEVAAQGVDGDLGYWTGRQVARVAIGDGAEPTDMVLRVTEVFRRESREWHLVHRHADVVDG